MNKSNNKIWPCMVILHNFQYMKDYPSLHLDTN
jgi:hypothetical protein